MEMPRLVIKGKHHDINYSEKATSANSAPSHKEATYNITCGAKTAINSSK
jgi:hypothetical protein